MKISQQLKSEVWAEIEREYWQDKKNILRGLIEAVVLGACMYVLACLIWVIG